VVSLRVAQVVTPALAALRRVVPVVQRLAPVAAVLAAALAVWTSVYRARRWPVPWMAD
jgi:hypothetical protein